MTGDVSGKTLTSTIVQAVAAWSTRTGDEPAVYVVGSPEGPVHLDGLVADRCRNVWLLQWLSRRREHGTASDPVLVIRDGTRPRTVIYRGANLFSGDITLEDGGGALSVTTQPALSPLVLGAVLRRGDAPDDYGQPPYVPPDEEMPDDIYDDRVLAYRSDDGMVPEAIWLNDFMLSQGTPWVAVINSDHLPDYPRIPHRYSVGTERLAEFAERAAPISLGVSTGSGLHVVTGMGADRHGRFRYRDPWGGRSLLCRENNTLGVDARRAPDAATPGDWTITVEELRVAVRMALVWWRTWAELNGVEVHPSRADVVSRMFGAGGGAGGLIRTTLTPEATELRWRLSAGDHRFDLRTTVDADDRVRWVRLTLERPDAGGLWPSVPGVGVLLRVLESTLTSADHEELAPFTEALQRLADDVTTTVAAAPAHLQRPLRGAVDVLTGAAPSQVVPLLYSELELRHAALSSAATVDLVLGASRLRVRPTPESRAVQAALQALGLGEDPRATWEPRPGGYDAP